MSDYYAIHCYVYFSRNFAFERCWTFDAGQSTQFGAFLKYRFEER